MAALYVLLHHTSSNYLNLKHTIWGFPFRFGLEAVLVFFILSGFVICYSHQQIPGQCEAFSTYFIKRFRRIYPIFILSLMVAYGIACINARGWAPVNFPQLLGNLFMLQDLPARPGSFYLPFADNMPLWSLSFEWWFYMMYYPINRWISRPRQKFLVLALVVLAMTINLEHPNGFCWFITFFIIWWVGVELAHEFSERQDISLARQKTMIALIGLPLLWYLISAWHWLRNGGHFSFNAYPIVELRYFLMTPIFVGLIFAWKQIRFIGFQSTIGKFYRLGSISYALYVLHFTILCDLRLFTGENLYYLDLLLRFILIFILAWLAEGVLQKWVNHVTNPLVSSSSRRQRVD